MGRHVSNLEEQSVCDRIRGMLDTQVFLPGDRLHVPELADRLRLSATPVREALSELCAEGLLEKLPYRGFFVRWLDQEDVSNLYEMKHMLLSYAVEGSVSELEPDDPTMRSASALARLEHEIRDPEEALEVFERHAAPLTLLIGSLSRNDSLLKCLKNILRRLQFVSGIELRMDDLRQAVVGEAAVIARGLLERDEAEVKEGLRRQLRREQAMLPDLMKECLSHVYLRRTPSQPRQRRAFLTTLSVRDEYLPGRQVSLS